MSATLSRPARPPAVRWRLDQATPYLLLLPALLLVVGVTIYPIWYAIDISLWRTHFLRKVAFLGFGNYLRLVQDGAALASLWHSLVFACLSLVLTLPIGMGFALLLNRPIRLRAVFRTILIIPWTLSQSVSGMLWLWLLNPSFGPISYLVQQLGGGQQLLLSEPGWAMVVLCAVNTWMSYPLPMVMFLAALQTVPPELHEAARIDGCGAWSGFWRITLPTIRATVASTSIMTSLQFLNTVTLIYVMTGGGPIGTTETLSVRAFLDGFFRFHVADAAVIGMMIFVLNIVFSVVYIRVLRMEEA